MWPCDGLESWLMKWLTMDGWRLTIDLNVFTHSSCGLLMFMIVIMIESWLLSYVINPTLFRSVVEQTNRQISAGICLCFTPVFICHFKWSNHQSCIKTIIMYSFNWQRWTASISPSAVDVLTALWSVNLDWQDVEASANTLGVEMVFKAPAVCAKNNMFIDYVLEQQ